MARTVKQYSFNGLAGCVSQRVSRETGTLVGLYHGDQSGMETDPATPWCTVCEEHHTLVCHETLQKAKEHLGYPTNWCDDCRESVEARSKDRAVAG